MGWIALAGASLLGTAAAAQTTATPTPLLNSDTPVSWWFAFKFNTASYPASCPVAQRACSFGGVSQSYSKYSQEFAYASSANTKLQLGGGCAGDGKSDPVGATFNQIYSSNYFYVVWNDQFYKDPIENRDEPWGHSKGVMAWDASGNGVVMQVSTPDWPGAGNKAHPRQTLGNTLGCIAGDDDIEVSQHFFALKLNHSDVVRVLNALVNASVVTDTTNLQIVKGGGPADVTAALQGLGVKSASKAATTVKLSSGVTLISKPSGLHVPPWQMVSSLLGGEPLRVATWWDSPEIYSTTAATTLGCWDAALKTAAGAVEIATSGTWLGNPIGLKGGATTSGNHAKVGVSTGTHKYSIFGDMNQQGSLTKCTSSQDARGGLFFVVDNAGLHDSVTALLKGESAPVQ